MAGVAGAISCRTLNSPRQSDVRRKLPDLFPFAAEIHDACITNLMQGRLFERDIYTEKFFSAADATGAQSPVQARVIIRRSMSRRQ